MTAVDLEVTGEDQPIRYDLFRFYKKFCCVYLHKLFREYVCVQMCMCEEFVAKIHTCFSLCSRLLELLGMHYMLRDVMIITKQLKKSSMRFLSCAPFVYRIKIKTPLRHRRNYGKSSTCCMSLCDRTVMTNADRLRRSRRGWEPWRTAWFPAASSRHSCPLANQSWTRKAAFHSFTPTNYVTPWKVRIEKFFTSPPSMVVLAWDDGFISVLPLSLSPHSLLGLMNSMNSLPLLNSFRPSFRYFIFKQTEFSAGVLSPLPAVDHFVVSLSPGNLWWKLGLFMALVSIVYYLSPESDFSKSDKSMHLTQPSWIESDHWLTLPGMYEKYSLFWYVFCIWCSEILPPDLGTFFYWFGFLLSVCM